MYTGSQYEAPVEWIRELIQIGDKIMKTEVNSFFQDGEEGRLILDKKKTLPSTQNLSAG